ncbi:hypothetical protein [Thermus tengchongensis]|uniref:hypothetical protein n=1 Tax=Thermus tengchongensis TaxID=1214928 RepID=UPI0005705051|nr:hypothetical protein [Thermus tengchongensis]
MRCLALGIATGASLFWGLLLLLGAFAEGEGRWLIGPVALMVLATLVAWRWAWAGGWALLFGGLAFGLVAALLAGRQHLLVFLLAAGPYALSGALLVFSIRRGCRPLG